MQESYIITYNLPGLQARNAERAAFGGSQTIPLAHNGVKMRVRGSLRRVGREIALMRWGKEKKM